MKEGPPCSGLTPFVQGVSDDLDSLGLDKGGEGESYCTKRGSPIVCAGMSDPHSTNPEIPEWLRQKFAPPTPPPPDALQRARQLATAPTFSTSPPEKSPAVKLQDSVTWGRKVIETNKATKDAILQWARRVRFALLSIFGKDATIVKDLDMLLKEAQSKGLSRDQFAQRLADVESLVAYLNRLGGCPLASPASQTSRTPSIKDVFIIHGHDELNIRRLSQLLQAACGLNPVAMLAKPGMGRPLVEKFEHEAQTCSFAFALFTPDDDVVKPEGAYKQARPNVIYEVGWFIGRLGRERVTLLLNTGATIHSDLDGVSRIHFTDNIEDKFIEIQKELRAAGMV